MTNTQMIQGIYDAFLRGDIQHILNALADDVDWVDPGAPGIPYAGTYRGVDGVAEFFQRMGQTTDVLRFEPKVFVEQGDMVATFGDYECRSRATGRAASSEWAMRFDVRNGKVIRFQAFVDTAALASAYQSSAASASQ